MSPNLFAHMGMFVVSWRIRARHGYCVSQRVGSTRGRGARGDIPEGDSEMRFSRRLFLIALATLVLFPAAGRAQGMTREQERVRRSMDETDRRIELAESVVSTSDDAQARSELALARDLRGRAKSAAGSGQYSMGGQLTTQARGHADRAIALARGLPNRERLRGQVDRTREMLDRAGQRIQACGDDRARALLRVALEMQGRAERAEGSGRVLGALQLTMGALERGLLALRRCGMEESAQQAAERALSRTDEVLARARERLESGVPSGVVPPQVRGALARATALQEDAARQFRDGRWESSLQLTLNARRLARRGAGRGFRMP